eukprot:2893416-Pleurochrysis_carterae.AAC.1
MLRLSGPSGEAHAAGESRWVELGKRDKEARNRAFFAKCQAELRRSHQSSEFEALPCVVTRRRTKSRGRKSESASSDCDPKVESTNMRMQPRSSKWHGNHDAMAHKARAPSEEEFDLFRGEFERDDPLEEAPDDGVVLLAQLHVDVDRPDVDALWEGAQHAVEDGASALGQAVAELELRVEQGMARRLECDAGTTVRAREMYGTTCEPKD